MWESYHCGKVINVGVLNVGNGSWVVNPINPYCFKIESN